MGKSALVSGLEAPRQVSIQLIFPASGKAPKHVKAITLLKFPFNQFSQLVGKVRTLYTFNFNVSDKEMFPFN